MDTSVPEITWCVRPCGISSYCLSLDGTHCEVRGPGGDVNEKYRCRHHYLSLNVLVVVGASGRFYYCSSSSPGVYLQLYSIFY